ncbi:MAG: DNA gyrase subunit A [Candidatus Sumerlaeota bacterium]|nr:DNA gyrase subunit A [Candidatus Sumerlaeota bacterium]
METQRERVIQTDISDELKTSYIDYAMSVIVGRALPDVRDGFKPVHRRIIFAMRELGLAPNRPYMKCARIVGETMGIYHPHGDIAIYDSLVRMAQDFSMRYPLIDGQGNFGSLDGDPPAAFRYTEARLASISELLLADIDKNTVNMVPNYDGKNLEPEVLPSAIPNLLVNGSSGIAVGMATNIPPHNLSEVVDTLIMLIDNPQCTLEEAMTVLPGPDFPTGGYIFGREGIEEAYRTGRGILKLRARVRTEQLKQGREAIVITEIPYTVNKANLMKEIAELVKDKKIQGLSDIRDESDRDGVRAVLELKKGEISQVIINNLYKHTSMQISFGIILLALVNGRPRYLSLMKILSLYLEHRCEVVRRRTHFDLERAEARLHIVDGLVIAVSNIDEVISIIRKSKDVDEAREKLMKHFSLSQLQAQAILDMRLQRLTGLEIQKLKDERKELLSLIKELKGILDSPKKVNEFVRKELLEVKEKFGDARRTEIVASTKDLTVEDLIAEENMVITISHQGYIKRTPTSLYRRQRRGGRGVTGMESKEGDWAESVFVGTTHDYLLFFTNKGRAHWLKVYELPQAGRASKGRPIINMIQMEEGEKIQAVIPVGEFDDKHFLIMATKNGMVVKNALNLYSNPRRTGIKAMKIDKKDELICVRMTNGQQQVFLGTLKGLAVRFHETEIRACGRYTGGVIGIRLAKGDRVIGMEVLRPNSTILTVCENGYGKRSKAEDYRLIHRGGKGVINIKVTERNGEVISIKEVIDDDELIMLTQEGMSIRVNVGDIRVISRNTQGVRLINLKQNDKIVAVARMEEKEEGKEVAEGEEVAGEEEAVDESGGEEATTEEAPEEGADK